MNIQQALNNITKNIHLTQEQMEDVMRSIMSGETTDAQIGALLMGLRLKGESIDEMTAAARVMREFATKIDVSDTPYLVDIVGTGGDGQNIFNVSTASAFVIAAAGATIAKHGGRGVSGKSGSSDLLEQAGISLELNMQQTERCIRDIGVGFLFAPNHHKAMKYAAAPRKELGIRTLFNLLGPLTNPAGVKRFVIGVFSNELCRPMAEVLKQLGAEHVMVVHSKDGLDEISLASATYVAELKNGEINEWMIQPEDVDIESQTLVGLTIDSPAESLALIKNALGKKKSDIGDKAANMIALNAGAGIYVSGLTSTYKQGVALAHDIIYGGQALEKMDVLSEFTKTLKQYEA
ncbi:MULTISPECIES: anthranilate phosphoribosyltransferase [Acinetobacter]|uniref:Anthranilate phosphoribosyltransferase n=1 Tax=Acinetobacter faecalis TaxID=2665161 RepID=A0AB35UW77_9GAMM|nr:MULTISPECIES: anthranilate phosphoribosyltransferase [Acinetobacter]MDY6458839.1 anthranilate phosphoribosyltransferase [Acinetobacter faecalis]MDY6461868.1 anthranilate phosphoribosyltransferase [Acinetobacter faecalis]MDY6486849.1 anthranilate phosphoribosyltransferase [Acinetobacter faecalis]MDY6490446.1 anthranilate phosphoribosyltransferase [Acinetobacter faecalis]MDY6509950.1 anthranilate phosphoribosyltransferase [Acinetobacter faecalis]